MILLPNHLNSWGSIVSRRKIIMGNEVKIPKGVLDGLEHVRKSGLTNMLDYPGVARLCKRLGYREAHDWILNNRKRYAEGIFVGFCANDEEDEEPAFDQNDDEASMEDDYS